MGLNFGLCLALAVSWFLPPVALANRQVFLGDWAAWFFVAAFFFHSLGDHGAESTGRWQRPRKLFGACLPVIVVFVTALVSGLLRPSLKAELNLGGFYFGNETDLFQWSRDGILFLRFLGK